MIGRLLALALTLSLASCSANPAFARDDGQWGNKDAQVRNWFQGLMQPDQPSMSCCGEADAFEADTFEQIGDHYVAVITDGRGVVPSGTRIPIPNDKLKWDKGNPTGHGILFLGVETTVPDGPRSIYYTLVHNGQGRPIYCYVTPGGA